MKTFKLLPVIIITISLFSCKTNRYIYTASAPNSPAFTDKGDSKVAAYYSSSPNTVLSTNYAEGFAVQAAYAITNHWAVTSSYFHQNEQDVFNYYSSANEPFDSSVVNYKRNLFDIGGGYFINLNDKKTITFNFFGGVSMGKFSFTDNGLDGGGANYNRFHASNITQWYLQPSISFLPTEAVRFGIIIKPVFVHYGNIKTSYITDELDYFNLANLNNKTKGFLQFSSNMQLCIPKYSWVKLDMIFSSISNNSALYQQNVRRTNVSIGLNFDLSKLKKNN
jgi:hypothetical protein